MATAVKYFNDEIELKGITGMRNEQFVQKFGNVKAKRYDSFAKLVGNPVDFVSVFDRNVLGWTNDYRPVQRTISYKVNGSKHVCDSRCMNAKGGNCECSCGGKNHGRGYSCE